MIIEDAYKYVDVAQVKASLKEMFPDMTGDSLEVCMWLGIINVIYTTGSMDYDKAKECLDNLFREYFDALVDDDALREDCCTIIKETYDYDIWNQNVN